MRRLVAIIGTYRKNGIIDQAVDRILAAARENHLETNRIYLADKHVEFCSNCRACMQNPGEARGKCVQKDDMASICDEIDAADALVIASPVNYFNVTAVTRRFMERLVCYGYWPWGQRGPAYRIRKLKKPAVVVTATAMPALMGRIFTGAIRALKLTARSVGAKPVGSLFIGLSAMHPTQSLSESDAHRARALGLKLHRFLQSA